MKRLVICCDGTWNRLDARDGTNVARLAEAILGTALRADGGAVTQVTYHLDGVGSGRGAARLARAADRILGGAFGWGLDALIEEAYRFLVLNYEPGDEIYLFGFSRGAYCARSLCGLIRRAGILERRRARAIPKAMTLYRARDTSAKSAGDRAKRFRAAHASHVTTVPGEAAWRVAENLDDHPDPEPLRLAYLGVWDTVGSLGVPKGWIGGALEWTGFFEGHQFHDTKLSPLLRAARHAVAIDERRRDFEPTLWDLADLRGVEGVDLDAYPQRWFPGVHGAVGGGAPDAGLALGALDWIVAGAEARGLVVDGGMRRAWAAGARFDARSTRR